MARRLAAPGMGIWPRVPLLRGSAGRRPCGLAPCLLMDGGLCGIVTIAQTLVEQTHKNKRNLVACVT